jgi:hypothetical protein
VILCHWVREKGTRSFETSETAYPGKRHVLEYRNPRFLRCGNVETRQVFYFYEMLLEHTAISHSARRALEHVIFSNKLHELAKVIRLHHTEVSKTE